MLLESRFLEGPNLYFRRPAVKVTLDISTLLEMSENDAGTLARVVGLRGARAGDPGGGFRALFARRLLTRCVRRVASAGGTARLAVRTRAGAGPQELVVVVPWRHGGRVEAFCHGLGDVVASMPEGADALAAAIDAAGAALLEAPEGRRPSVLRPRIPVVGITGTNGKTTTSRMIGHIGRTAGLSVGWSSTEGVFFDGELVDGGDYSGPGGARLVLSQPGVQLGVLETARGGILRRGVGVTHYDVAVVTNVSADHLGVDGIETLDQLAEVKAVVPRVVKSGGWTVLNADDPRVWPMRLVSDGTPWAFSRDAASPHVREALDEGGRATVVLDGWITVLENGHNPLALVEVVDVPMTLSGLSSVNVENTLAAASAALGLGFPPDVVAEGLRSFRPDRDSAGRMNVFTLGQNTIVIDMAHNEASFAATLEIAHGLAPAGAKVLLGIGSSGDRSDDSLVRLGEIAGLGADGCVIKPPLHYLRGRSVESYVDFLAQGLARAGQEPLGVESNEIEAMKLLVEHAAPADVIASMVHEKRQSVVDWIVAQGGSADSPEVLRRKVLDLQGGGADRA